MLTTRQADFTSASDGQAILALLDAYARDPMGGGTPLSEEAKSRLIGELAVRPFAISILAFDGDTPVGLINAFEGFSTFAARPLLNLHDIAVLASHRGRGIATAMMKTAEAIARERNCCKLTLEVLSGNGPALRAYEQFGFRQYALDPEKGSALFLEKKLT